MKNPFEGIIKSIVFIMGPILMIVFTISVFKRKSWCMIRCVHCTNVCYMSLFIIAFFINSALVQFARVGYESINENLVANSPDGEPALNGNLFVSEDDLFECRGAYTWARISMWFYIPYIMIWVIACCCMRKYGNEVKHGISDDFIKEY